MAFSHPVSFFEFAKKSFLYEVGPSDDEEAANVSARHFKRDEIIFVEGCFAFAVVLAGHTQEFEYFNSSRVL